MSTRSTTLTADTGTTDVRSTSIARSTGSITRTKNRRRAAMTAIASAAVCSAMLLSAPAASAFGADDELGVGQPTCPGNVVTLMTPATGVGVEAPAGWLIAGYCAIAEGAQADNVAVDPAVPVLVFSHSSGNDITQYSLVLVPAPFDPDGQLPGDLTNPEPGDDPQPADEADPNLPADGADEADPVLPGDAEGTIAETAPGVGGSSEGGSGGADRQPAIEQLPVTGFGTTLIAALASALLGTGVATIRIARRPH